MPPRRTTTASINARVTPELDLAIRERAARQRVSHSEALRQLLDLGALLERAEVEGLRVSDGIQAMVARREPFLPMFARDREDPEHGPLWLVTPEEVEAAS